MNNEENSLNTNNNENKKENVASIGEKKSFVPYIIIGVCAVAALGIGLFVGKKIIKNKQLAAAQEYIEWESQNHTWVEADCQHPKTCSVCGATEGEVGEHEWEEATCSAPKTCKVCGATEGEALEHDWKLATLDTPKTCKNCGATEGGPISFVEYDFAFTEGFKDFDSSLFNLTSTKEDYSYWILSDKAIAKIGYHRDHWTKGGGSGSNGFAASGFNVVYNGVTDKYYVQLFDYEGNALSEETELLSVDNKSGLAGTCTTPYGNLIYLGVYGDRSVDYYLYDESLNLVSSTNMDNLPNGSFQTPVGETESRIRSFGFLTESGESRDYYFDMDTRTWIDEGEANTIYDEEYGENDAKKAIREKYSDSWNIVDEPIINGYFVRIDDGIMYTDEDGNELAKYVGATHFMSNGYALASEDGTTYDIIDKDFNVIAENVIVTDSYVEGYPILNLFKYYDENYKCHYYRVVTSD